MHMFTGLSWHSTWSDGRPCFLYLSLYFQCNIIITCFHAWGTHSIQSDRDRVLFHPRKSSRELTPTFHQRPKFELFLHSPIRLHRIVHKEAKGQLCLLLRDCFPLELSISCFYYPRLVFVSSVDSLACIFYPFLVFRSFVVRRLLPNADTRQ